MRAALHAQVDRLAFAHTSFFTTDVAEELAAHLVAHAPAGLSHAYFLSGGSEAVEAALKMARQYHLERGEPERLDQVLHDAEGDRLPHHRQFGRGGDGEDVDAGAFVHFIEVGHS